MLEDEDAYTIVLEDKLGRIVKGCLTFLVIYKDKLKRTKKHLEILLLATNKEY